MHWAKSKGERQGELSREDFRRAVLDLWVGASVRGKKDPKGSASWWQKSEGGGGGAGAAGGGDGSSAGKPTACPWVDEIDGLFDRFDLDANGTLNEYEAKEMIKGLRQAGYEAAQQQRIQERKARASRERATQKVAHVMESQPHGSLTIESMTHHPFISVIDAPQGLLSPGATPSFMDALEC